MGNNIDNDLNFELNNGGHNEIEDCDYCAFISYRRSDTAELAEWLSHRLEHWKPTRHFVEALPNDIRLKLQQKRRVFLDKRYEVGTEDFWTSHIEPALSRSAHLIVLSSPDVFRRLSDGRPNWVEQEINTFFDNKKRRDRISVALARGAPEDRFPGKMQELSERWDWADFRHWSPWGRFLPNRWRQDHDGLTKILSAVFQIPAIFMPLLRQEEVRRVRRQRILYVISFITFISVVSMASLQILKSATEAREQKIEQQRQNSRRLATLSLQATEHGDAVTGILLALRALPEHLDPPNRPLVAELWQPLRTAMVEQRETMDFPHDAPIESAAFSSDGSRVVTASRDGTARVWYVDGSGPPNVLRGHDNWVMAAAFSPNGERVLTASADKTARVWRADGTGVPVVLRGHEDWVNAAAFSPDGVHVVTASSDGTARVWRADADGEPVVLRGHEGGVTSAAFSPDGMHVVTASSDKTGRVWPLVGSLEELAAQARLLILPRQISAAQKKEYLIADD